MVIEYRRARQRQCICTSTLAGGGAEKFNSDPNCRHRQFMMPGFPLQAPLVQMVVCGSLLQDSNNSILSWEIITNTITGLVYSIDVWENREFED